MRIFCNDIFQSRLLGPFLAAPQTLQIDDKYGAVEKTKKKRKIDHRNALGLNFVTVSIAKNLAQKPV